MSDVESVAEAYKLLEKVSSLGEMEKEAFKYFIENVSVGVIRAVKDLKARGVKDPEEAIAKLVEEGLIEEGAECYNLAKPLRELIRKRGSLHLDF